MATKLEKIRKKVNKKIYEINTKSIETLPKDIEEKLLNGEISFSDLLDYPSLINLVRKGSFEFNSRYLIEKFGFKNTMKLFIENPKIIAKAADRWGDFPNSKIITYEMAKKTLYEYVIERIPYPFTIEDIPEEMIKMYPSYFIQEGELPKEVTDRYNAGKITFSDLRRYKDVLKNKNLNIGCSDISYYFKNKNNDINSAWVWDFLDKISEEYDTEVYYFIYQGLFESKRKPKWKPDTNIDELLKEAITFCCNDYSYSNKIYTIEKYFSLSKFVPLENIIKDKNELELINLIGLDKLVEFNKQYDSILNKNVNYYRVGRLLSVLAKNIDCLNNSNIDLNDTYRVLERLVHESINYIEKIEECKKVFPREFIDMEALDKITTIDKETKKSLLVLYKNNGIVYLVSLINEYPELLPFVKDKNLHFDKNEQELYSKFPNNLFWDLSVQYGSIWLNPFINPYGHSYDLNKIIEDLKNKNYDLLNEIIYNYLFKHSGYINFNILNLPESFKKKYSHLYLQEDAPLELKEKYYMNGPFYPTITPRDLKENPDWVEFLKDKELKYTISATTFYINYGFYGKCIEMFGKEFFLQLCVKYGPYLRYNPSAEFIDPSYNRDNIEWMIKDSISSAFKQGQITYDSNLPDFLKEDYRLIPYEKSSPEIKDIFKNRTLTIKTLANNPELYAQIIDSVNIACGFSDDYNWLVTFFNNDLSDLKKTNIKRLKIAIEYDKLTDEITRNHFIQYITENKDNIDFDKISDITNILVRISTGNSLELLSLEKSLIEAVLKTENPEETLKKIENVFIKNNLPLFAKIFLSFQIIYPTMKEVRGKIDFTDNDKISPLLTDGHIVHLGRNKNNIDARFNLIFNDLFRIAVHSGNRSLISYIDNIEKGDKLYKDLVNEKRKFLDLTKEEIGLLKIFTSHLEVLYENTKEGSKNTIYSDNMPLEEKLMFFANKFKPTDRIDLKDRIVRSFAYYVGYKTFDELKNDAYGFIKDANKRNEIAAKKLGNGELILDEGDFIRGIGGYDVLSNSINNGNVSKEFLSMLGNPELGNSSTSDMTPLDIDFGKVQESGFARNVIQSTPAVASEIMFVIKHNNPNFLETRDKDGNIYDRYNPKKGDLFRTLSTNHFGVRTGIAISEVDYILYNNPNNTEHLNIVKHELARNGLFVPVVDYNTSKLVFTYEEYKEIREKMQGLKYYGSNTYTFSPNLENTDILEIKNNLELQKDGTKLKRDLYVQHVKHILKKYGIELYAEVTGELETNRAEFIDTGSTGRGTNVPNDGDFDFVLKLDQKIIRDDALFNKLKKDLRSFYVGSKEIVDVNNGNFRDKGVIIPGLEEPIDIDITFMPRTDKIAYSTDECIKDRLETIKNLDEEKYKLTVANIVFAKKLLKAGKAYKAREKEGGLGGVGVETWILNHGGSLIDAARSFVKASDGKSLEEFKKGYSLYDFGENHRFFENQVMKSSSNNNNDKFIHDDFVNNLRESGYEKMKEVLNVYIKNVDLGIPNPLEETLKEINPDEYIDRIVYESASLIMEDSKKILETCVDGSVSLKKANLGQTGFMYEFTHDGKSYLAKPGVNKHNLRCRPARAVVQEVASSIQKIVSPKTCVDVKVYGKGTVKVAVQEKFLNAKSKDASSLIKDHTKELLGEYVCDYLLGNFDSDASNFIIDAEGHLRGIDKEQSLKYTEQDDFEKSLALDFSYMPEGSRVTIYPSLINYIKTSSNYEDYVKYLDEIVHKLQTISDEKYLSLFSDYVNAYDPKDKALMFERILERKKYFEEHIEKVLKEENGKVKNY